MSKGIDRAVVEDLYRKYWFQVLSRCRRILGNEDEALDAAQEVFVRLISKGGVFRGQSSWMTWLYRVATNICLNKLRSAKLRDKKWQEEVKLTATRPKEPDVDTTLSHRATLKTALMQCDEKTQKIALYHFWDQMTQQEIGSLLGLSRVTVNKRLQVFRKVFEESQKELQGDE